MAISLGIYPIFRQSHRMEYRIFQAMLPEGCSSTSQGYVDICGMRLFLHLLYQCLRCGSQILMWMKIYWTSALRKKEVISHLALMGWGARRCRRSNWPADWPIFHKIRDIFYSSSTTYTYTYNWMEFYIYIYTYTYTYTYLCIYVYMYICIYVYNMYTICIQYVYNMYTICIQYVYNMYTICIQYVYNMYIICI